MAERAIGKAGHEWMPLRRKGFGMVRRIGHVAAMVAMSLLMCASAWCEDMASLRNELADMKAKMASMESRLAAPVDGSMAADAAGLESIKKNAHITIGGDVNIDLIFRDRDDATHDQDHVNSVDFRTHSANLRFKIKPVNMQDAHLYIKLDLDDEWEDENLDGVLDQDDILEEVKFVWEDIKNSGVGFVFGKGEVAYGQDRTLGIIQSYHHNDSVYTSEGPGFIVAGVEDAIGPDVDDANNPHSNVANVRHPGEVDNVFQAMVSYKWKEIWKFEATLFQNREYPGNDYIVNGLSGVGRGMHEDRPDDNMLFQSWAFRAWFAPTENLLMQASVLNMHNDSRSDREQFGENTKADQTAVDASFRYFAKSVDLEIFGEYQHGWNWNYTDDYTADIVQLGFDWGVTNKVNFGAMYEYMQLDDENGTDEVAEYQRIVLNTKYSFAKDAVTGEDQIYMMLEYGYEYVDHDIGGTNADDDRNGHLVGFRTGMVF